MRLIFASILICSAAFLLTACGPSKASAPSKDDTPKPDAEAPSTAISYPASDYIEQEKGIPGGTLKISTPIDTGTLDFQTIAGTSPKWLGRILYDCLVYLDDQGNITPWLAKSWEISPDGKNYTFHLRDDVTFSDGAKFNAEAVLENLRRIRDPATKTSMTTAYIAPYVDGKVIDEYTFEAHLSEPYTPFLNVLAQSWLGLMSPKALKENPKGLGDAPVGSGPFVVESYARQKGIRFVKRKDYHWAPPFIQHAGPAYLDRIEVDFVPEALLRYTSLASGQYDLTTDAPPQNADAIRADSSLALKSRVNLGNPTRAITFNVSKEPFIDVNVRKAFALAIDRQGIGQIIGFGEYRLKTDFLSSDTRYYDPSFQDALKYNPDESNRLLDAVGWAEHDGEGYRTKNGQRLSAEILTTDVIGSSAIIVAIQSDLKKIGFELKIVQLPAPQLLERRNANTYQALSAGYWHTNTPDGLYIVYHSKQINTGKYTGQNVSRLEDPELDDLLTRARQSQDPALLRKLYSQAQKRLTEVIPAVPIYENHTLVAYKNTVKGVIFDTSHNVVFFTTVWLKK